MEMPDGNEVVLIAEATALPGKREKLLRAVLDDLIPESIVEPDVSVFRLHEDRDQTGHFMLYGRFHNRGSVEAHLATEHFASICKVLSELAEGGQPTLTYYAVLSD
jgi:quinol monooxygenase YgiN